MPSVLALAFTNFLLVKSAQDIKRQFSYLYFHTYLHFHIFIFLSSFSYPFANFVSKIFASYSDIPSNAWVGKPAWKTI